MGQEELIDLYLSPMEKTKRYLTHKECNYAALQMAQAIDIRHPDLVTPISIYGVPRGGIPVGYLLSRHIKVSIEETPENADVIVDDIVDSGRTQEAYTKRYTPLAFLALTDFLEVPRNGEWIVFPWEQGQENRDQSAYDIPIRLLQYIGEDPGREGLVDTPRRFLAAWEEWTSGYNKPPKSVLKSFEDGAKNYDEMVMVKELPFYSHCEHHLAPFFGTATIAYIPQKRIVGLSKLGRLVDIFARRLQVQERLTVQIADALQAELEPLGVAVYIKARHLCMESRGLSKQGHQTETSAVRGVFRDKPEAREEFFAMART